MEHSELPEKWKTIPIKELFSFVLGGDWGKDPLKFEDKDYELALCIRGSEIKNWATKNSSTAVERLIKKTSLERRTLIPGDVLIEISGGGPDQPVGRTIYIDENSLINDKDIPLVCTNFLRMMRFHPSLNSKYIQQFLQLFYDSGSIIKYQGGSNNLRNLKFKDFETIKIPIAPRPEQDRIVSKVDTLMAQVETMQKSLERIPQLLKDFRQQVLTQAVTGKLTDLKVMENKLGDLLEDVKYGTSKKSLYDVEGTPIFRIPNIKEGEIDDNDVKFSNLDDKELEKLKLKFGDVLIIRSNGSVSIVGQSAIIRNKHIGYSYAGYLIRLRCKKSLDPEFLNYSLQSNFLRTQIVETARSTSGVNNINSTEIKELNILVPKTIDEQKEIVSRVEILFSKADVIETEYQNLKAKIDTLPQAILHKAFKGELVEQLESDWDASELLREIEGLKKVK